MTSGRETLAGALSDGMFVDGDWVETKDQDPNGEVRLIQLADIGDGEFRNRSSRFLTQKKAGELGCTFLLPGDVLVARMPEPLGRACVFPGVGQPAVTAVDICILRPNPRRINTRWLTLAINSPAFRSAMQEFVRGTTRARISRKNLGSLEIKVPLLVEQSKISAEVDDLRGRCMTAQVHIGDAQDAVERYRRAVLAAACAGRLTADWRDTNPSTEPADAVIERSRRAVRSTAVDKWAQPDWLELPESWRWAPVYDLGQIRSGIQKQPKRTPNKNAYPYLRVANVLRGRLDLSVLARMELFDGELDRYRLAPGDLLVVEGNGSPGEIGRASVWRGEIADCVHQNHIIRVRFPEMDPEFVELFWNSPIGAREIGSLAVTTAGLYSLTAGKIGAVPVPIPPIGEQREIVRRATALITRSHGLTDALQFATHRLRVANQMLLSRALPSEQEVASSTGTGPTSASPTVRKV